MDSLIRQAQDGDTEALGALWEQTKKFALAVSRRFQPTAAVGTDDLQQCAWLGFHTAVQKHAGRHSFLTLVDYCVRIECQQALHIRTSKCDPATVSGDTLLPDGEHTVLDLIEDNSLPESDAALIAADLARDVRAAVAELPKRERTLIKRRWLGDKVRPLHNVGKRMGISVERTRQLEARAFERLRADPVLRSYASAPPNPYRTTGLSAFTNRGSSVERAALRRTAYADLLSSLKAEGYI